MEIEVSTAKLGNRGTPALSRYVVAVPDKMHAVAALMFKEKLLDERVNVVGEADQALLEEWKVKPGEVFCVVAWT